jgi:hypothetical protein
VDLSGSVTVQKATEATRLFTGAAGDIDSGIHVGVDLVITAQTVERLLSFLAVSVNCLVCDVGAEYLARERGDHTAI